MKYNKVGKTDVYKGQHARRNVEIMYLEVRIQFKKQGANGEAKSVITTNKTRLK